MSLVVRCFVENLRVFTYRLADHSHLPAENIAVLLATERTKILTYIYMSQFAIVTVVDCVENCPSVLLLISMATVKCSVLQMPLPMLAIVIENEGMPIQLALCRFPGLAISSAKI